TSVRWSSCSTCSGIGSTAASSRAGRRVSAQRVAHALEPFPDLLRELADLRPIDEPKDGLRIHERDGYRAVALLAHDNIARQQQADIGLGLDRSMREWRIARAENLVGPALDAELALERLLDVDLGQHTKAFRLQRVGHAL